MDNSKSLRRRSMLPQLAQKNETRLPLPSPTRMRPTRERTDSQDDQPEAFEIAAAQQRAHDTDQPCKTSMPPPPSLGRLRSLQPDSKTPGATSASLGGSQRSSSATNASNVDHPPLSGRTRASSGIKMPSKVSNPTSHGRSSSQQVSVRPMEGLTKGVQGRSSTAREFSTRLQKPAFSTLQQHYSPKKSINKLPPIPTKRSSKSPDDESIERNMRPLQTELTQLHIMHRTAPQIQHQWECSAKAHYQTRFEDLYARHLELKDIAHEQQTLLNQFALVEWCQGIPSSQVAEKVQTLSRNIADLRALLAPDGKYTRVLEVFISWFDQARGIQDSRRNGADGARTEDLMFIEGIGDGWKAEAMVLERELTYCSRDLKDFGEVREGSSIGRALMLHRTMVANLLSELDVTQWIESQIMVREATWMEDTIDQLSSKVSNGMGV